MFYKILLTSTLILPLIKINDGMNWTWKTDDQDLSFPENDFSGGPPSPGVEMFQELYGTPVDQIIAETHAESSTSEIQNVTGNEKTRQQWAQEIFLEEYQHIKKYKFWNDLRYNKSWSILCYLLWDKHPNMKRGQECSATRFNDDLNPYYNYRVVINKRRYKVDLLQCKCPKNSNLPLKLQKVSNTGLYFFVTPCAAFHNSYYIMSTGRNTSLEVFDIRNTTFSPEYNIHETRVQTYGQPDTIGTKYDPKDEKAAEKMAQKKFLEEFCYPIETKPWDDLRNEVYENSWSTLCFLLLDIETSKRIRESCTTTIFHELSYPNMSKRVVIPGVDSTIYVDLLACKCDDVTTFYVTKSFKQDNSYYIMRPNRNFGSEYEVYDLRDVIFNPGFLL